jgi:hypothetical protein
MTVLANLKLATAGFLAVAALAIVLSPAYGATVIDNLASLTSTATTVTSIFHTDIDAISSKLAVAE